MWPQHPESPDAPADLDAQALSASVAAWFARLDSALAARDEAAVEALFVPDCHWRDLVALTWSFNQTSGRAQVLGALLDGAARMGARGFGLAAGRTAPRTVTRSSREVVEAFHTFDLDHGRGEGVVRLVRDDDGALRGWFLLTTLKELAGAEGSGGTRPPGLGYGRGSTLNWADHRDRQSAFADREPEVLIAGAGHSGLMLAAHLRQLGVDTLVVDKNERVGDTWRDRYHSLALHTPTDMVHLPFMPFPSTFPEYLPKDQFGNWLEAYAVNMEINCWTSTEFLGATRDEDAGRWTARVRHADGTVRELRPQHVVVATGGVGGQPKIPALPGLDAFAGEVRHTSEFTSGRGYAGAAALVVGVGTSGHDTALDLSNNGATVTMMQRSPTVVVSLEVANLAYPQYQDGTPLEEADLISAANLIYPVMYESMQKATRAGAEIDRELHRALEKAGQELDFGEDGTGWMMKFFEHGGGYYIDVGASEAIIDGRISMLQARDVDSFVADGVRLLDGQVIPLDLVVLATGYHNQQAEVARYFGDEVAERIGKVSGFGEDGELRNAWKPTAVPGLYFMVSGIGQSRTYAPYLARRIKAAQAGLVQEGRHRSR
ncbi:MAG TPA: NAD(P)/FAD-dependent oxidoreductase [Amycolatopsis sp.]|nr:NAD(P)/FAD-dependent oxidoreductase [Amycolatopsis sp.]